MAKELTQLQKTSQLMNSPAVQEKIATMLGERAPQFIASALSAVSNNKLLANATPNSIYGATYMAAAVDLPINASLGLAYLVPYGNECQLQIGYKGIIQLAMRSGQYTSICVNEVYEGEVKCKNRFTEQYEFGDRTSDKIVGYMAYFKLLNGFEKYLYMSVEELKEHGRKYSKTYNSASSLWSKNFDAMAKKTVIKRILTKFGVLSIQMQQATLYDQAVIRKSNNDEEESFVAEIDDNDIVYVDNAPDEASNEQQQQLNDNKAKIAEAMKK